MSDWSPDMVRLMRDASERSDYHERLAEAIDDMLGSVAGLRVCDAGCGLGYLAMAMARRGARVTAIDAAQAPLKALHTALLTSCITHVDVWRQDVWQLPEDVRFDAMVFCLFGAFEETLALARKHCNRLVIVKRGNPTRRFALGASLRACDVAAQTRDRLDALGLPYREQTLTLALDQPFRTIDDALLFFRLYATRDATPTIDENAVRQRLLPGSSAEFPYVLPAERELTLFAIELC